MNNDKEKNLRIDIEFDREFVEFDTFDGLITHFNNLKNLYMTRENVVNVTLEHDYDMNDEFPYLRILVTRWETDEEQIERKRIVENNKNLKKITDIKNLQELMKKYPHEVSNWLMKRSKLNVTIS